MELILKKLFLLKDDKYKEFNSKIVPNVNSDKIIGVRIPDIRKLAMEIKDEDYIDEFLSELPHNYQEEYLLHGILLSTKYKNIDILLSKFSSPPSKSLLRLTFVALLLRESVSVRSTGLRLLRIIVIACSSRRILAMLHRNLLLTISLFQSLSARIIRCSREYTIICSVQRLSDFVERMIRKRLRRLSDFCVKDLPRPSRLRLPIRNHLVCRCMAIRLCGDAHLFVST